jgi:PPOX class probable F420-dependent enzyme
VTADEARARFTSARVARLATTGPHLVPICFAVDGDTIWSAVDAKPKRTRALRRLENIAADPRVAVLVDEYDDADWSRLWWARADGTAAVHDAAPHALALLCARYEQYADSPPAGPFVAVAVTRWSGWSAV